MNPGLVRIAGIFAAAEKDGRDALLEPEVYEVLAAAGLRAPRHVFLPVGTRATRAGLPFPKAVKLVVKIVSPLIVHKSDLGGVEFVKADAASVNAACDRMLRTVPRRYLRWLEGPSGAPAGKAATPRDVRKSIRGFLVAEKVDFEDVGFGSEILIGVRCTREFGPVLTVGGGGLEVEYMNERLREGRAAAIASAHLLAEEQVQGLLEPLAFFGKVAAEFRGRRPLVTAKVLAEAVRSFRDLATAFSPFSGDSPFTIEEAEVNPFVIRGGRLVALDGVCRFSRAKSQAEARPVEAIGNLLRPGSIGIVGVSEKMNIGRIILRNILKSGFPAGDVFVVKPGTERIEGCLCVPSIKDLPRPVDLFVLTLGADQCAPAMEELVEHGKARSVIIIAGGMGEKEGGSFLEDRIREILAEGRRKGALTPVVNGGNCLGIASKPGRYDTTFIPASKLPRPRSQRSDLALISQSGAFMICRMSKLPMIEPLYAVSLGNQIDLTASDYMRHLADDPDARLFAVYMEGFRPGDGLAFARAVREISAAEGRAVLVYKAGRSPEGRIATSSHTASVAGEYAVFRSVLEQAGAIVAGDLFEFESFMKGLVFLEGKKVRGRRVGLMSNAGFECVVLADNLKNGAGLELGEFGPETRGRILAALRPLGIDRLQDVRNPLDVTPVADDAAFCECARAILADPGVDCAVISNVPMTPAQQTLAAGEGHGEDLTRPEAFASRMIEIFRGTDKPVVVNLDAGELYTPLAGFLERAGVPVFRRADEAVRFLRAYVGYRLR
jgi:acyl-CoA synthetase (NDP forming)